MSEIGETVREAGVYFGSISVHPTGTEGEKPSSWQ